MQLLVLANTALTFNCLGFLNFAV